MVESVKINAVKISLIPLSFLLPILPLGAQDEPPPPPGPPGPPRGQGGEPRQRPSSIELIERYDTDKDGRLSREEFDQGDRAKALDEEIRAKLFKRFDKDGDGFITRKELKEIPGPGPRGREDIGRTDTDKDGRISYEEFSKSPRFMNLPEERRKALFNRFDSNKDGFLDPKDHPDRGRERRRPPFPRIQLKGLDLDENGSLSWAEFQNAPSILSIDEKDRRKLFERLDEDKDGEVSGKELRSPFERDRERDKKDGDKPDSPGKGPKK